MIDRERLQQYAAEYGVTVDNRAAERFDRYAELLVDWNTRMNLTAITSPEGIVLKHFADSLTALPLLPKKQDITVIDVGTGAGFPGIPLAIVREDIELTLLDSLNKRLVFLREVCDALGIRAKTVHARAEEGGQNKELREMYDVSTARAVAALPVLTEYCLPFVKTGGRFIAMKGPDSDAELAAAKKAVALLGGRVSDVQKLTVPCNPHEGVEPQERRLIVIEKEKPTPPRFPRPSAKIAKEPLG
ncbi:MAG: 16S rRNA (guanine(527)-N(7))-methyltransferase RsmG [Clostridia bacterium]|nr:16S rRNA (guanine(527)-N(7))-methyltransferase RsmG [Clostridia bacterium]